jgi:uncharacterized protein (TIGR02246 family)
MRGRIGLAMFVLACGFAPPRTAAAQGAVAADSLLKELVAVERAALDRWVTLDPGGYLDLYAPDVSYFDSTTEKRVDGREAMEQRLAPIRNMKPPFVDPRYEMIDPRVQRHGDAALLTFNLVNYGKLPGKQETALARWNATEVYTRIDGRWRIVHTHWSFVKPDFKPPSP